MLLMNGKLAVENVKVVIFFRCLCQGKISVDIILCFNLIWIDKMQILTKSRIFQSHHLYSGN